MERLLRGQVVLVTGATGSIGAAIVARLAAEGARPIIQFRRDEKQTADPLLRVGGDGWLMQADLADPNGPTALCDRAVAAAGRVHALVNNAGIRTEIAIDADLSARQSAWRQEFQVHLFAAADLAAEWARAVAVASAR